MGTLARPRRLAVLHRSAPDSGPQQRMPTCTHSSRPHRPLLLLRKRRSRGEAAVVVVALLAAALLAAPPTARSIEVEDVPLFAFKCRRAAVDGPMPPKSTFYVGEEYYGTANAVSSNGTGWSAVGNFSAADRAKAAATYQNTYMARWYAMTTTIGVYPVVNNSNISCVLTFIGRDAGAAPDVTVTGRLYPAGECVPVHAPCAAAWQSSSWLGLVMYREDHANATNVTGAPVVTTMREFNAQKYWGMLNSLPAIPKRPSRFPFIDSFAGGDSDLDNYLSAVTALSTLGLHGIGAGTQPEVVARLRALGHNLTTGGTFVLGASGSQERPNEACAFDKNSSCNFHPWDHKLATDADLVNDTEIAEWASSFAAGFAAAGYSPEEITGVAQADEPSWTWDSSVPPVDTSPWVREMWVHYLRSQGLAPEDIGHTEWGDVLPIGREAAGAGQKVAAINSSQLQPGSLAKRRLFYWTSRFSSWSASQYMANTTRALQEAIGNPKLGVYCNWCNWGGQPFAPGDRSSAASGSNNSARMAHDWFEHAALRGGTTLWTEDWFPDEDAYHWSFLISKLRSAAYDSPYADEIDFAGYSVPRSSGSMEGGILLRMLAQVGGGAKALRIFIFGPEYAFPNNCWSDHVNASRIAREVNEVSAIIGAAEDVLWPAVRPRAAVGIVSARSASYYDQWEVTGHEADGTCLGCCTSSLLSLAEAHDAEVFSIWKLLTMRNIPVDFLSEDSLRNQSVLAGYKAIIITEANVPSASMTGALTWARTVPNATLLLSPFAGQFDEYNSKSDLLPNATGVTHKLEATNSYGHRWILAADTACYNEANSWWCGLSNGSSTADPIRTFSAWGVWGGLEATGNTAAGSYANGDKAIVSSAVGSTGRVVQFGFWPGISWYYSNVSTGPGAESTPPKPPWAPSEEMADMLVGLLPVEARRGPVTVAGLSMVETPLLVTPDQTAAVVTLLDWSRSNSDCVSPCAEKMEHATLTVALPFVVKSVECVVAGELTQLTFENVDASGMEVQFTVAVRYAGMVVLRDSAVGKV